MVRGFSIGLVGPSGDQPSSANTKRGDPQVTVHLTTTAAVLGQQCSKDTKATGDRHSMSRGPTVLSQKMQLPRKSYSQSKA